MKSEDSPPSPPRAATHGARLLVLAADAGAQLALCRLLDESGYSVEALADADAAVEARATRQFDALILADVPADPRLAELPQLRVSGAMPAQALLGAVHALVVTPGRRASSALDAFGHASTTVRGADGRCMWQSPLSRQLMAAYFAGEDFAHGRLPPEMLLWLHREALRRKAGAAPAVLTVLPPWPEGRAPRAGTRGAAAATLARHARRLSFDLHATDPEAYGPGQWLIVMRESDDASLLHTLMHAFGLNHMQAGLALALARGRDERALSALLGAETQELQEQLQVLYERMEIATGLQAPAAAAALARARLPRLG